MFYRCLNIRSLGLMLLGVTLTILPQCDTFYINTNEHYRANVETETREDRFTKWMEPQAGGLIRPKS